MQNSRPVVRWVVGECHTLGYDTLYESIKSFKKIYKNNFIYCICFNSKKIKKTLVKSLELVDKIIDQKKFQKTLPFNPFKKRGPHWKLYPPRLFPEQHELILDNDLIIYEEMKEIEEFLSDESLCLTTRAIKRSYNKKYEHHIKRDFNINTGLVGLPPFFDYQKKIEIVLSYGKSVWKDYFDEQTVVAGVLQSENTKVIPFETISSCCGLTHFNIGKKGTHFIGINKGYDKWWKEYKVKNL